MTKDRITRCDFCDVDSTWRIGIRGKFKSRVETAVCRRCGLIYERRRLSDEALAMYYEQDYFADYASIVGEEVPAAIEVAWQEVGNRRVSVLASAVSSLEGCHIL